MLSHIRVLVPVQAGLLPIQFHSNVPRKAAEDEQGLGPLSLIRVTDGVPDSGLQPDPDLAVVAIWKLDQQVEDFLPSLCP